MNSLHAGVQQGSTLVVAMAQEEPDIHASGQKACTLVVAIAKKEACLI
jgi:hypothetical protein